MLFFILLEMEVINNLMFIINTLNIENEIELDDCVQYNKTYNGITMTFREYVNNKFDIDTYINISDLYNKLTGSSITNITSKVKASYIIFRTNPFVKFDNENLWTNLNDFIYICLSLFSYEFYRWIFEDRDMNIGYIYILGDHNKNEYKIGRSVNIKNRFDSDYNRNHNNFNILRIYESYNIKYSEKILKQLKDDIVICSKKQNEYFTIDTDHKELINEFLSKTDEIFIDKVENANVIDFNDEHINILKEHHNIIISNFNHYELINQPIRYVNRLIIRMNLCDKILIKHYNELIRGMSIKDIKINICSKHHISFNKFILYLTSNKYIDNDNLINSIIKINGIDNMNVKMKELIEIKYRH